jgi:uncharacterized membrane protein YwzB
MIGTVLGIFFTVILLGVLWWAVQQLLPLIPLGEPFVTIIRVMMVLVMVAIVLWVIIALLGTAGVHVPLAFPR